MSIQDESFPHDELFEVDLSPAPLNRFQFPHRLREHQHQQQLHNGESSKDAHTLVHNLSISSSSADQTISSAESATEQHATPPSEGNERMVKSDQSDLSSIGDARTQLLERSERKSHSYHDIHSAYTKRRYKHIESKVGQYIANIRDEDERRRKQRGKFQRQCSLPESLVREPPTLKAMKLQRGATFAAESLNQALVGLIEAVDEEGEENEVDAGALTSVTLSTQSGSGAADVGDDDAGRAADGSNEGGERIADNKAGCIDRNTFALLLDERNRLKSYNDYQQLKLDEKQSEITRLRQNVDYLRVRLSTAEDQLKKNQGGRNTLNGPTIGSFGYGQFSANSLPNWGAGRQSLQGLLYCTAKSTKETQTECYKSDSPPPAPPPSPSPINVELSNDEPQLFETPDTADANNNLCGGEGTMEGCARNTKSVAAIQPMSLNFSSYTDGESAERRTAKDGVTLRRRNSFLIARQERLPPVHANGSRNSQHNSRHSHPSSSDSAIDVEVIELSTSPKPACRKHYPMESSECGSYATKVRCLQYSRDQGTPSPTGLHIESCPNSTAVDISATAEVQGTRKLVRAKKRAGSGRSISRRWLHLFDSCVRCKKPKQSEREHLALQQTYTQVPLLERSCISPQI